MPAVTVLSTMDLLRTFAKVPMPWHSPAELLPLVPASRPTLTRRLAQAEKLGWLESRGGGPTRRYRLTPSGWEQLAGATMAGHSPYLHPTAMP